MALHRSLKVTWEKRQALPASLVITAVDALPVLVEGGSFTGAAMDSMFGDVATKKPWAKKENCRVEITVSKAKYNWGVCEQQCKSSRSLTDRWRSRDAGSKYGERVRLAVLAKTAEAAV